MSTDEALGKLILDYCRTHGMSLGDFSKKSIVSKGHLSKITKNLMTKYGVSSTIKNKIAKGMDITPFELEKRIADYQKGNFEISEDDFIIKINNKLKQLNEEDAEKIFNIISNANSNQLDILCNLLKNMK